MIYKEFQGIKLSQLGMGAMRLPVHEEANRTVDQDAVDEMVRHAMKQGVNYFDTAWGYHGGQSEVALGNALTSYQRDRFYLADKFPGYDHTNMSKVEEIFEEQLKRCQVDYFDFYLYHNVCELNIDGYLDHTYGLMDYFQRQKKEGRIRHLGFSAHGSLDVMKRFLQAYGNEMEFGQLQINYLDWTFQDGKEKVDLLNEYQIPVWVMEPLRGGQLASYPEAYTREFQSIRPEENAPSMAFRFLQSIPEVTVILSGMSNMEQLVENIHTFQEDRPLNHGELTQVLNVAQKMLQKTILPCTGCEYCLSYCPQKLDIPYLLRLYNEHTFTGGGFIAPMALSVLPEDQKPAACIGCRSCEEVCPQQIRISEALSDFAAKL